MIFVGGVLSFHGLLQMLNKKESKGADMDGDDDDYPLTPGTEENYRRIDEQYASAMQQQTVVTVKVNIC